MDPVEPAVRVARAFRDCVATSAVPNGLGLISPTSPSAGLSSFAPFGAGFCAIIPQRQLKTSSHTLVPVRLAYGGRKKIAFGRGEHGAK